MECFFDIFVCVYMYIVLRPIRELFSHTELSPAVGEIQQMLTYTCTWFPKVFVFGPPTLSMAQKVYFKGHIRS